jgi:hypothetical protein
LKYSDGLIEEIKTVPYNGFSPLAVFEHVLQLIDAFFTSPEFIQTHSYSNLDWSSLGNYLQIAEHKNKNWGKVLVDLRNMLEHEQLVHLEIISPKAMIMRVLNLNGQIEEVEVDIESTTYNQSNNNCIAIGVENYYSILENLLQAGADLLDYNLDTVWIISGNALSAYSSKELAQIALKGIVQNSPKLPRQNKFYLDSYSLSTYYDLLEERLFAQNQTNLLKELPMLWLDSSNFTEKKLDLSTISGVRKQASLIHNNYFKLKETTVAINYPELQAKKDELLVIAKEPTESFLDNILQQLEFKENSSYMMLPIGPGKKNRRMSVWKLKVGKELLQRIPLGKELELKPSEYLAEIKKQKYVHTQRTYSRDDLKVVHGQFVEKGDELIKRKRANLAMDYKAILANTSGVIDTSLLEKNFISIAEEGVDTANLSWLSKAKGLPLRKDLERSTVDFLVETCGLPLLTTLGISSSCNLAFAENIETAKILARENPRLALALDFELTAKQLQGLYDEGISFVVLNNFADLANISTDYWQLFGLGQFGSVNGKLPEVIRAMLKNKEFEPAFLSVETNELKLLPFSAAQDKFTMAKGAPSSNNLKLEKGDLVTSLIYDNWLLEAQVLHLHSDGQVLLKDLATKRLFSVASEHVRVLNRSY